MGVLFTCVPASALWRHLDIRCACLSSSVDGKVSYVTLIRAIVITLCSTAVYAGVIFLQPGEWQAVAPEPAEATRSRCAAGKPRFLAVQK